MMPAGLRNVVELVVIHVHAARRKLVQQRLPQMRKRLIEQRYARTATTAQPVSEVRRQFQSAGAAADDHDVMHDE
jgi:hypothetical protein